MGGYGAQAVENGQDDGGLVIDLPIENTDQAAKLLLGFGTDVEVLGPPDLRDCMRTLALEIAGFTLNLEILRRGG